MTGAGLGRRTVLGALAAAALPSPLLAREARASRAACLEWTSAEMLLSLGVAPVAVADTAGYRDWAVAPALAPGTIDLGSRGEPSLERIAALAPDLIVTAEGYGLDEARLARFAPLFVLDLYTGSGTPVADAERELRRLAARVGQRGRAERFAAAFHAEIAALRSRLAGQALPKVAVISLFDDRHVRIYGRGGLFQDVMDRLGVGNAWTGATSAWGFSTVGLADLVTLDDCLVLSLQPVPVNVENRIRQSTLWASLPNVREGRVIDVPAVWPFGGLAAAARFARFLHRELTRR